MKELEDRCLFSFSIPRPKLNHFYWWSFRATGSSDASPADVDVEFQSRARATTIREFLAAVKCDCRAAWLRDCCGPNAPQPRFDEKDDADVIEELRSPAVVIHLSPCDCNQRAFGCRRRLHSLLVLRMGAGVPRMSGFRCHSLHSNRSDSRA